MAGSPCPACLYRPSRKGGLYCRPCLNADDQVPWDHDLKYGRQSTNVVHAALERRQLRISVGQEYQALAEDFLTTGEMTTTERKVWAWVVEGQSERWIANQLSIGRSRLQSKFLEPLKKRAGLPSRPRWYPRPNN